MNLTNAVTVTEDRTTNLPEAARPGHIPFPVSSTSSSPGLPPRHRVQGLNPSLRVPVRPANREYLRALRAAEMAVWEASSRTARRARAAASARRRELASADDARRHRWEAMGYALLAVGSLIAGWNGVVSIAQLVTH
jgi:hypothetical protein